MKKCPNKNHHYAFDDEYTHCPYCGSRLNHYEGKIQNNHTSMSNLAERIDLYDMRFQIIGYLSFLSVLFALIIFSSYAYDVTQKNHFLFITIFNGLLLVLIVFHSYLLHRRYKTLKNHIHFSKKYTI